MRTDHIPAVTLGTTGHLPHLVQTAEAPRPRADQIDTNGAREHAEPTPCHMYPGLCVTQDGEDGDQVDQHGRHFDHGGKAITVPSARYPNDPEIWAEFTHCSGSTPQIGFMSESFTPDQAREKAQQLRQFADDLDNLADRTEAAVRADVANVVAIIRQRQANATGPLAEALGAMADLVEKTGAPNAVAELVLHLAGRELSEARG